MASTPQRPRALTEGETVAGKYLLLRQLGEGGRCFVYEAEHVHLRQGLALKVLKPELAGDAGCVTRFEREARAAAQLRSPNVARVFDVDYLPDGVPYITMELLVGHDLGTELSHSTRLPASLAVEYVRQACSGIEEAHAQGIVHRDLKPENLFLTELGPLTDRKLLKILDFGIAKNISDNARRLTAPDAVFGTVDYMSPEQIRSASRVDHRTDLWSLGVILYELLTGRTPYHGDARSVIAQIVSDPIAPPSEFVPDLPPGLVAAVMRALEKDPANRYQSADEFRDALALHNDLEPIMAVIARLPPLSVPRRSPNSLAPNGGFGHSEPHLRDGRTNVSWEAKPWQRGWGKAWLLLPAAAVVVCAVGGAAYAKKHPGVLTWLKATPRVDPTYAPPKEAALAPTTTPATSTTAGSVEAPTATGSMNEAAPAPVGAASPSGAASPQGSTAKGARAPRPRPAATPAPTPTPPPPSPAAAASASGPRLPKHL